MNESDLRVSEQLLGGYAGLNMAMQAMRVSLSDRFLLIACIADLGLVGEGGWGGGKGKMGTLDENNWKESWGGDGY